MLAGWERPFQGAPARDVAIQNLKEVQGGSRLVQGGGWFLADSPHRGHARIHDARVFGLQDRRVQVILLSTPGMAREYPHWPTAPGERYAELNGGPPTMASDASTQIIHRVYAIRSQFMA